VLHHRALYLGSNIFTHVSLFVLHISKNLLQMTLPQDRIFKLQPEIEAHNENHQIIQDSNITEIKICYHESETLKFLLQNTNWYATILRSSSKQSWSNGSRKPTDTVTLQILSITACAPYTTLKFNKGDKHTMVGGNLTVIICRTKTE